MSKVIALDAGHGLYTAGKRCLKALDAKETREWVLNDRIVDKLQKMLESELTRAEKLESIYYRSRKGKPFDFSRLATRSE